MHGSEAILCIFFKSKALNSSFYPYNFAECNNKDFKMRVAAFPFPKGVLEEDFIFALIFPKKDLTMDFLFGRIKVFIPVFTVSVHSVCSRMVRQGTL
jgi:hypothetical protein